MAENVLHKTIKLPADAQKRLKDMGSQFQEAEHAIEQLDRMGMDATEIKKNLTWAKNIQKILLEEFS